MSDIPDDVREAAESLYEKINLDDFDGTQRDPNICTITLAILAERERCASYIERYAGMVPERQEMAADIRAGVSIDAWGQRRT